MNKDLACEEYIRRESAFEDYVKQLRKPRVASPRETGDIDPVIATGVYSTDGDPLISRFIRLAQKLDSARRRRRTSGSVYTDRGPHLSRSRSPTQTMDPTPSGTGRVAVQTSPRTTVSQLPLTMRARSQRLKEREDIPSSLKMATDALNLANETAGMAAFTSARTILPMAIKVGFLPAHVDGPPANVMYAGLDDLV